MAKISVIMPVYNAERYLKDSIESILNQTFKDYEFLICDDGSNDNSVKIVEEYSKKDKRDRRETPASKGVSLTFLKSKKRSNLSKTR